MTGLLLYGAIVIGLSGLISDANGLITLRFFIGIVGATFVPCQYWASQMFSYSIVGTANAICGGFGNMGAGVSYFLIPLIYNAFALVLPPHQAWRVTFVVPALLCITMAAAGYFLGDDCPGDEWKNGGDSALEQHDIEKHGLPQTSSDADSFQSDESGDKKTVPTTNHKTVILSPTNTNAAAETAPPSVLVDLFTQLKNPSVVILMIQYGCSFGLELAVDNMIGEFFHEHFGLSQTTSGMLGSIFGLMNLFSRASGGMLADYVNSKIGEGVQGRMLVHFCVFMLEGAFLIGFSSAIGTLSSSIVVMILFSYFVQAGCGTTFCMLNTLFVRCGYCLMFSLLSPSAKLTWCVPPFFPSLLPSHGKIAIVPFANPRSMGAVYGLVGAGGSVGSIVFNYVYKIYGLRYADAFRVVGYCALGAGMLTLLLKIQGRMLLGLYFKKLNP